MFFSRAPWDYSDDILGFCEVVGAQPWTPSKRSREFLLAVQRGYQRVGLAGAADAWRALATANLWLACCRPDHLQLVMAGTTKSGHNWVRYLKHLAAESADDVRLNLLFTDGDDLVLVRRSDDPVLSVLTPGQLIAAPHIQHGRPTVLVLPDIDRVLTKWLPSLKCFIDSPQDQWLTVAPARR
jgi:hypothetical protein